MNPLGVIRYDRSAISISNRAEIVSRYKHLRQASLKLIDKLVKGISRECIQEAGRKLGIWRDGTLVFDSEDQASVLMDYCLHDVRHHGRNVIEQCLIDSPPDEDSDEMACLRARQHARYSLFVVEAVERGLGVRVRDLVTNDRLLIVDIGFGSTAKVGLVLASRLLPFDDFFITGGAALPLAILPADQLEPLLKPALKALTPDEKGHVDPARLIQTCLSHGYSSKVQYQEPTEIALSSTESPPAKIGRNSPCPCGSGKKFKQCCLKNS